MSAYLSLTAFVGIEPKCLRLGVKDASAGLKLTGSLDVNCDISIDGGLWFVDLSWCAYIVFLISSTFQAYSNI